MRINEVQFDDSQPVDGYGPGFFRIGEARLDGAIILMPSGATAWGGFDDAETILRHADAIDVLLVGTGRDVAHLPKAFRQTLEAAGIGVEPMATPSACRTYNVLLSEGRRVGAALIPVD